MRTLVRKMGNSRGIIIPKPLLTQIGLEHEAELVVENDAIVIRKPERKVRDGWEAASKSIAVTGDDILVWPEFGNEEDAKLEW